MSLTINERQILQDLLREEKTTLEVELDYLRHQTNLSEKSAKVKLIKQQLENLASIKRKLSL